MLKLPLLLPALALSIAGCIPNDTKDATMNLAGKERDIYVAAEQVDCVGVAPMKCMQVRESPDQPWERFYGSIEGFDYRPGTSYRLRIIEIAVENPPADGSSIRTVLKQVLHKS